MTRPKIAEIAASGKVGKHQKLWVTGDFNLPNDRVDVLMTYKLSAADSSGQQRSVSETVLMNVRVLAIDQTFHQ
jgi:Flp pilus assembly protein CpaB